MTYFFFWSALFFFGAAFFLAAFCFFQAETLAAFFAAAFFAVCARRRPQSSSGIPSSSGAGAGAEPAHSALTLMSRSPYVSCARAPSAPPRRHPRQRDLRRQSHGSFPLSYDINLYF